MRVKIAYTVDISEVESEVKSLLSEAVSNLEKLQESVLFAYNNLETLDSPLNEITNSLEESRKIMFKVDSTVSDCHEILVGYSDVIRQLEEQAKQELDDDET